ncbi:MAG: carboxypeptidase regulatory-like domain-containing protein [Bryobacterales bacterium]|nr:carboxypeptidase regulatory-like domain-containing protein [Bryobacterales bacterium]
MNRLNRGISARVAVTCAIAALLFAYVAAKPAAAQVLYGSLVGTVEDQSGAVVPKATVTIINKAIGQTREAASDDGGRFSLLNVLAGTYDLKVSAQGFRTTTKTDVEVAINTVTRADMRLEVGAVTEQVTVQATAAVLQTDKSDVRHEISSVAMTQLPLPAYRNYQTLLNLIPGTTPATFQNAIVDTPARALTTRVNGTPRNMNNTLTDGAVNIFIWLPHHTAYVQPVESIEAVNISTGSLDAEQGLAGGAAITVVTKSGTNEVHGSGFWFHNNQRLLSEPYYRAAGFKKPVDIFNQFGGTIGGPIKKDKLFYFFSYERTMYRQGGSGNWSTPPAEFRVGDFSSWPGCTVCGSAYSVVYDPASSPTPAQRQPFPNNQIPRARISPIFDAIQKLIPVPNQKSPTDLANNLGGNFGAAGTLKYNRNNYDIKGNWNASPKLVIWGKLSRMGAPVTGKHIFGDMVGPNLGTAGIGDVRLNMPTFGFTHTFSPTFMMDAVFGYTRHDQDVLGTGQGKNWGLDVFKIPGTNGGRQYANDMRYSGVPQIATGFTDWGLTETWLPLERRERSYTSPVNFSKIRGSHEFRWGFEPRRLEMNHWQPETANPRGYIGFGGGPTMIPGQTGRELNSYATALLGLATSYTKSIQYFLMQTREWQYAWYFRDRWQATRRLTVNLGMHYEYYPLMNRASRGMERWDPATNIVTLGGLGNVPRENGITVSKKLITPRVGLAYRVGDNWVIRSGYGINFNPLPFSRPLRGLYPATLTGSWGGGTAGAEFRDPTYGWFNTVDKGIPDVPTPDVSKGSLELPLNLDMAPRSPWGGRLHRGYIQSWNFTVERKLPLDTLVSAGYVATRTIHQMLDRNINTVGPGLGGDTRNLPLAKLYGRTNAMSMWDGIGYGSYNSLQVALNKSFSKGLFLKGAFTWSRYMNMSEDDGWASLAMWSWEPMIYRNYAPSSEDRRRSFTLAWVYELPFGQGKPYALSGLADKVLGGWKINGVFSMYSGTPFTVSGGGSSLLCTGCSQTADQIAPVRKIDQGRGPNMPYYDPMSFRDPLFIFSPANPVYRPGTMGRNALYGPGFWRVDPAIYKEFKATEKVKAEFRAEAVNLTNTPRWGNPAGGAGGMQLNPNGSLRALNNFMSITGASSDRQFRFGMRVVF